MSKDLHGGIDPTLEIQQAFHLAGLRMLAEMGLTGAHQRDALGVIRDFDKLRREEVRVYHLEYQDRVNDCLKRLIDEGGAKDRGLKPEWIAHDRFNPTNLRTRAERRVRHAHQAALGLLDRQETRALEAIAQRADQELARPNDPVAERGRRQTTGIRAPTRRRPRE